MRVGEALALTWADYEDYSKTILVDKQISCEFHIDTTSVEQKYADGDMVSIYCPRVEDQIADTRIQRTELDWLVYYEPPTYAQLVLSGELEEYPKGKPLHKLDG